ncbi:MAG: mannose-1-phosphate guanylyltransferase [Candidatus Cloacimonetes bacterium]|nr:mannose-1-phosphate guanylyltransferase [Candidatus Cloacimonadota bacterium]
MIALIMAGGVGTRFWPLSRKSNPKQFLPIISENSMIKMTVDRLKPLINPKDIYIVTAKSQVDLVYKHLPELPKENVIIEPFGMNTAPCIGLSFKHFEKKYDKNEVMIVLPADHLIKDEKTFLESLKTGKQAAQSGNLITFGIKPNYPAIGYGYIEAGKALNNEMFYVKQFKEKPDEDSAKEFLSSGNFFWNSGMFMWSINAISTAFENYLPNVSQLLSEISVKWNSEGYDADISNIYEKMDRVPIDIGIMEKAEKRGIIPVDYGWSDVGGWKALYDISQKDESENVFKGNILSINSTGNYVNSKKMIALIGIDDLVIVESDDAILITKKDRSEEVKDIVETLKKENINNLL